MALTERYSTELQDNLPHRRHFIRVWEGLTADLTRGTGGWTGTGLPAIGDAYPYGTWTGLITPRCARVDVDPRWQVGQVQVVAHYYGPLIESEIAGTTGSDYLELACLREHREYMKKSGKWRGRRVYSVPTASMSTLLPDLRKLPWTVNTIKMKPRFVNVVQQDPECPGCGRVTLEYAFKDNPRSYGREYLGESVPVLSITGYGQDERLRYGQKGGVDDLDQPIETQPLPDGTYYKLKTGSNIRPRLDAQYTLRMTAAQSSLPVLWAKARAGYGMVNKTAFDVITGNTAVRMAEPGEIMLMRIDIPEWFIFDEDDPVVPVRFQFHYRPGGFGGCQAQQFIKSGVEEYIYHSTDDALAWVKAEDKSTKPRQFLKNDDSGDAVAATNKNANKVGGVDYGAYASPKEDDGTFIAAKTRVVIREVPVAPVEARTVLESYDFNSWLLAKVLF